MRKNEIESKLREVIYLLCLEKYSQEHCLKLVKILDVNRIILLIRKEIYEKIVYILLSLLK